MAPWTRPFTGDRYGNRRTFFRVGLTAALALLALLGRQGGGLSPSRAAATPYNWLQFGGNPQHSSDDRGETTLTTRTVGTLHRLFQVRLPGIADSTPVYLSGVTTSSGIADGVHDLLFISGRAGELTALDAHTGLTIWSRPKNSVCAGGPGQPCFTTASPAIDPTLHYIYSYAQDGFIHKTRVGDGADVVDGTWPEVATRKVTDDKISGPLSIATARSGISYLYATTSSHGDNGDYQGHLTTINLGDGSQHVFNLVCSDKVDTYFEVQGGYDCPYTEAGAWGRGGVLYLPDTDKIYLAVGNGAFSPPTFAWGDSVLALNPDGTGAGGVPLDSYTPVNYQQLQDLDHDLGSFEPAVVPPPPGSTVRHLALQSGKDSMVRLLNLDNLSGQGGPAHVGGELRLMPVPQGGKARIAAATVWPGTAGRATRVFLATERGLSALKVTLSVTGTPSLHTLWTSAISSTTPVLANGILFTARPYHAEAYDAANHALLWADSTLGAIHWASPLVANGVVYVVDLSSAVTAYGL